MKLSVLFILVANCVFSQCEFFPTLNIGNDTILCQGSSVTYSAPAGYDFYEWSTGANSNSIIVNSPSTIWLVAGNISSNLVINGDFEAGNTGFTSAYIYGTGGTYGLLSNEGQYAIATSPSLTHNNFFSCADHTTTGVGNMLVANGSGIPNTSVWCQTVTITPNTDYLFSTWFMNALNDANVSNLQFFINNVQIGAIFSSSPTGCIWEEFNQTWNSGSATSANLCIKNQNTTTGGNDFALDDIKFQAICLQSDTIEITYDPLSINIANDLTFCANESEQLTVTSNVAGTIFTWQDGSTGSTFTPTTSGTISVSATSENGCFSTDNALVNIIPMPWNIDTLISISTSCNQNNGVVSVLTNGTFNDVPLYNWNGPGASNPNQINASVWTNLSAGWYYLTIESQGCFRSDSLEVKTIDPPVANFTASVLEGCSPLTVNFNNLSQNATSFNWNFGNGNTINGVDQSTQSQVFTGNAIVQLIANQNTCADTTNLSITVIFCGCTDPTAINYNNLAVADDGSCLYPIPTIETFNVFTPNNNGDNEFYYIKTTNTLSIHLTILNRWGQVLFDETNFNPTWDGKVNGTNATEGVYFYKYAILGLNSKEALTGQGFFQLIR